MLWRQAALPLALATAMSSAGCAATVGRIGTRSTCTLLSGALGGAGGAALGTGDAGHRLAGLALGTLAGAALSTVLCRDSDRPARTSVAIRATPEDGEAPLAVNLTAVTAPEGEPPTRYEWDFGDGTRAEGASVMHIYPKPGQFTARLTVTDRRRRQLQVAAQVSIERPMPDVAAVAMAPIAASAIRDFTDTARRRLVLRGTNFAFDSAELTPADAVILDVALEQLRANPRWRVRVVGHTDSTGTDGYNQELSELRARAVLGYLVERGIARERLTAAGRGESRPIASNASSDGRAQNRRVELEVLG